MELTQNGVLASDMNYKTHTPTPPSAVFNSHTHGCHQGGQQGRLTWASQVVGGVGGYELWVGASGVGY